MAILFSEVTVEGNGSEATFLVRGIPREYDDLQGWTAFEDFLLDIDQDTDILVHADAYLYGEGETFQAIGFQQVSFDESQAQKPSDLLRVVYVEPGKPAYSKRTTRNSGSA